MDKEILKQIKPGARVAVQDKFGTFQGIVLSRKHGQEPGATFTVRTSIAGVGVEKIYPIYSPNILKVKILLGAPAGQPVYKPLRNFCLRK